MRGRGGTPTKLLATVFFTDMVGSTERAAELGDRRWRVMLSSYHQLMRQALRRHGGRELDSAGDGFFALFDQPAKAIACAQDVADRLERIGILVRSGVHVGQVDVLEGKVSGLSVHIGARIAALAGAGEIVVSSTVRDSLAGSDQVFTDRGAHALKGVPGEWRLFSVERTPIVREIVEPPTPQTEPERRRVRRTLVLPLGVAAVVVAGSGTAVALLRHTGPSEVAVIPGANQVAEIATDGRSFVSAIDVGGDEPGGLVENGGSLWVMNVRSQTLTRVEETTMKAQSLGVGGTPTGIAYAAGSIWLTAEFGLSSGAPGSLLRFDAADGRQLPSLALADGVAGIAAGMHEVWVTNVRTNTVLRIDTDTDVAGTPIPVGRGPASIAVTANAVWVANTLDRTVSRIDARTSVVSPPVAVAGADAIAADDAGVWVAGTASSTLTRIDPVTGSIVTTIAMSQGPTAVALAPDAVWVADTVAGDVVRIDPATNQPVQHLVVHGHPSAIEAQGGSVWVTVTD